MGKIYYYGKKTNFVGKTLFEILANLKNFGVNRMLIKQEELLKNPGQKCYYIVKKVEPIMDEKLQEGAIYAERVFKNAKAPGLVFVNRDSWHTDWQLIPKDQEAKYMIDPENCLDYSQVMAVQNQPEWMEVPPLMDIFLRRHYNLRNGVTISPVKLDANPLQIKVIPNAYAHSKQWFVYRPRDK